MYFFCQSKWRCKSGSSIRIVKCSNLLQFSFHSQLLYSSISSIIFIYIFVNLTNIDFSQDDRSLNDFTQEDNFSELFSIGLLENNKSLLNIFLLNKKETSPYFIKSSILNLIFLLFFSLYS